jgi:hypothetical protein
MCRTMTIGAALAAVLFAVGAMQLPDEALAAKKGKGPYGTARPTLPPSPILPPNPIVPPSPIKR